MAGISGFRSSDLKFWVWLLSPVTQWTILLWTPHEQARATTAFLLEEVLKKRLHLSIRQSGKKLRGLDFYDCSRSDKLSASKSS